MACTLAVAPGGLTARPRAARLPVVAAPPPPRRRSVVAARALVDTRESLTLEAFDELVGSHDAVLVDFYTTW